MPRPMIRIHNTETDEIIDREMNDAEYEQYLVDVANIEATKAAYATAKAQKQTILDRLGLTEDELRIVLG